MRCYHYPHSPQTGGSEAAAKGLNSRKMQSFGMDCELDFSVVDVETANHSPGSICQIGIACFRDGELIETWGELVNPEDSFLAFNTRLHGIGARAVSRAPIWPQLRPKLRSLLEDRAVASHTYFDRTALNSADVRYGLPHIRVAGWVDTCRIARQVWPHLANHKLTSLAENFRISYRAHDAIADAGCAGQILLMAAQASATDVAKMLKPESTSSIARRREFITNNSTRKTSSRTEVGPDSA
jgi:DNA polymerase-3 subunit epsilon